MGLLETHIEDMRSMMQQLMHGDVKYKGNVKDITTLAKVTERSARTILQAHIVDSKNPGFVDTFSAKTDIIGGKVKSSPLVTAEEVGAASSEDIIHCDALDKDIDRDTCLDLSGKDPCPHECGACGEFSITRFHLCDQPQQQAQPTVIDGNTVIVR